MRSVVLGVVRALRVGVPWLVRPARGARATHAPSSSGPALEVSVFEGSVVERQSRRVGEWANAALTAPVIVVFTLAQLGLALLSGSDAVLTDAGDNLVGLLPGMLTVFTVRAASVRADWAASRCSATTRPPAARCW